jgi:hypothetical protein
VVELLSCGPMLNMAVYSFFSNLCYVFSNHVRLSFRVLLDILCINVYVELFGMLLPICFFIYVYLIF